MSVARKAKKPLRLKANINSVPKLEKIVLSVGTSKALGEKKYMDVMQDTLRRISGQKPAIRKAKKSIAGFKVKQGAVVGLVVTLRRDKMYDFFNKLVNVVLPRTRDFRGISMKNVDERGNITIGIKEHNVFPEINPDEVELVHGLAVTITTKTDDKQEGIALFQSLGFPFKKK